MWFGRQLIKNFTNSNIPQLFDDYIEGNTYTYEDESSLTSASVVRFQSYYWRSATIDNTDAPIDDNGNVSSKWAKASVSNKFAMLDSQSKTKTTIEEDDLIVEFERSTISILGIGNFEASQIIIEQLDALGAVLATQTFTYSVNEYVFDYYDYENAPYSIEVNRNIKVDIPSFGAKLRVTFKKEPNSNRASCGFLYGIEPIDMGETVTNVNFSNSSRITEGKPDILGLPQIKRNSISLTVSFQTKTLRENHNFILNRKKELRESDEVALFIVDPSENSPFENMLVLGKLESAPHTVGSNSLITINWSIYETP